jgi:hypothetical protein
MHENMLTKKTSLLVLMLSCFAFQAAMAQGLTVTSGGNLVVNGNVNLIVKDGGFNNSGTFTPGLGTVTFSGTAASTITTIGGSSAFSFYNIGFNKSAGNAKLSKGISVSNAVLMQQGSLDLSTFDLDLGTSGSISGETPTSFINGSSGGTVLRTVNLNAPTAANPGNIGIEITSAANLGPTVIKRGHQQQTNSSGYSINRYYDIFPTNNTGLNATVKFSYLDAELASINESELKLWTSATTGGLWTLLGADAQDASLNYVLKNGVGQLNRFTLASSVTNPLPVRFLSFNGQVVGNNIVLNWATGFELNNHHFELEKSFDGKNFSGFSKVLPSGNAGGANYQSTDFNAFTSNDLYYRIKQVNNDGTYSYTKIIYFSKGKYANKVIGVYPNPATGPVHIRFTSNGDEATTLLQVFDSKGLMVASKQLTIQAGLNDIPYDISQLAQGVYIIKLSGIDQHGINIIKN